MRARLLTFLICGVLAACERHYDRAAAVVVTQPAIAWGVPNRPLRIVSYNVYWHQRGIDRVSETVKLLSPDIVMLAEVPPKDVPSLAQKIGLEHFYVTPNNPNEWAKPSTAILSRFSLENAHPIPNPGGRDFAVMAETTIDGKRFAVVAVHLSATLSMSPIAFHKSENDRAKELAALTKEWEARGKPPMIVGGDFNQLAQGRNYGAMTHSWNDTLAKLKKTNWTCEHGMLKTRVDYLLTTRDWTIADGGVATSDASDHRPIWIQTK
jgi:endonuclease/exonuclease/phosphatase family metal-dependent hydrolase